MRLLLLLLCVALGALGTVSASADTNQGLLRLKVIDPYIEVHSGPGRGYPIFYVIEEGQMIDVLSRRPGWYEVRSDNRKVGWAKAAQISRTLQPTGEPADLPSVSYGDYLKSRWTVGFTTGQFSSGELSSSETFTLTAGYRPLEWLGVELEAGKLFGSDIKGELYNANLLFEPFSQWKISPLVIAGTGVMSVNSQPKLVPLDIGDSDFTNYGIGANYYIGRNFLFRGEYRWYSVSTDNGNESVAAWKIGFNTFF